MSREVRRVPLDWKHPVEPNPYWLEQTARRLASQRNLSRLHMPQDRFVGLMSDYPDAIGRWEQEGRDLAARTGHGWTFAVRWHFTGYDDCTCHPGQTGVRHPVYGWSDDGNAEIVLPIESEDDLHAHLVAQHESEKPDPADYMPVFGDDGDLGWCLYETVSEGTPVTPVFATAGELVEHLAAVGQDWDQTPMRREAAETLVRQGGSFGSMVAVGGTLYRSDVDADRLADALDGAR